MSSEILSLARYLYLAVHANPRKKEDIRPPVRTRPSLGYPGDANQYDERLTGPEDFPLELIREWLCVCETYDGDLCPLPRLSAPAMTSNLRFVDVLERSIVEGSRDQEYVALSYVWGDVEIYKLSRSVKTKLMRPGGLLPYWDQIGLTIRDAIEFTSLMGVRYLWVDSLCLVQDDHEELKANIALMDTLYEKALFTIVAANGAHANCGLPRVRKYARKIQRPSDGITKHHENDVLLDDILANTVYNQRAWTFQEYHLSRRKVVFANNQVYFKCRNTERHENGMNFYQLSLFADLTNNPFNSLTLLLELYSARRLTKKNDALKAAGGICHRYSQRCQCLFLQGMPVAILDTYMLFRRARPMGGRRFKFASYSWSGWNHGVRIPTFHYDSEMFEWLSECSWIIWYTMDHRKEPSQASTLVWGPKEKAVYQKAVNDELESRKRKEDFAKVSSITRDVSGMSQKGCKSNVEHPKSFMDFTGVDTSQTSPSLRSLPSLKRPYELLQFWTLSARYSIHLGFSNEEGNDEHLPILDKDRDFCGVLVLDVQLQTIDRGVVPAEFLVLSKSSHTIDHHVVWENPIFERFSALPEIKLLSRSTAPEKYSGLGENLLCVLCIRWSPEDGIAERVGSGFIYQSALDYSHHPGPIWKEIILG